MGKRKPKVKPEVQVPKLRSEGKEAEEYINRLMDDFMATKPKPLQSRCAWIFPDSESDSDNGKSNLLQAVGRLTLQELMESYNDVEEASILMLARSFYREKRRSA